MRISIVGDDEYRVKMLMYLFSLALHSDKGQELVTSAIKSDRTLVIFDGKKLSETAQNGIPVYAHGNDYEPLSFNIEDAQKDYGEKDGNAKALVEGALGHEIFHFLDKRNPGVLMENVDSKYSIKDVNHTEVEAVAVENQIRKDFGMKERTHYGGINVLGKGTREHPVYGKSAYVLTKKRDNVNTNLGPLWGKPVHTSNNHASYKYWNLWVTGTQLIISQQAKK
jgi:hypothetical protein